MGWIPLQLCGSPTGNQVIGDTSQGQAGSLGEQSYPRDHLTELTNLTNSFKFWWDDHSLSGVWVGSTVHSNPISHQYGVTHGEHRLRIIFRKDLLFGSELLGGLRIEKKLQGRETEFTLLQPWGEGEHWEAFGGWRWKSGADVGKSKGTDREFLLRKWHTGKSKPMLSCQEQISSTETYPGVW